MTGNMSDLLLATIRKIILLEGMCMYADDLLPCSESAAELLVPIPVGSKYVPQKTAFYHIWRHKILQHINFRALRRSEDN